jgi:hypothetical protein
MLKMSSKDFFKFPDLKLLVENHWNYCKEVFKLKLDLHAHMDEKHREKDGLLHCNAENSGCCEIQISNF